MVNEDCDKGNASYFSKHPVVRLKERNPRYFVTGGVLVPEVSLEIDRSAVSKLQLISILEAVNSKALRIKLVEKDLPSSIEESGFTNNRRTIV